MKVEFVIPGEPRGKARPRFSRGHAYTPPETVQYEEHVRVLYKLAAAGKKFGGPIGVSIRSEFRAPKSASKKARSAMLAGEIFPQRKPDADNIAKIICDALNGTAYRDDSQIVWLTVCKAYAGDPCVRVRIAGVDDGWFVNEYPRWDNPGVTHWMPLPSTEGVE